MQANPLLQKTAEDITYDDTLSGIGSTNVQGAVETLARGKKRNVYSLNLPCGAGYGAYFITVFTHGVGPDIIQIHVSGGAVVMKSLITGVAPSGITSATYGSDLLSLVFAGPSFFSCIGADPNLAI